MLLEYFQLAGSHAVQHQHQSGFHANAAILKLRVFVEHVQTLRSILFGQTYARALEGLALTVTGPGPAQITSPRPKRSSVFDWS